MKPTKSSFRKEFIELQISQLEQKREKLINKYIIPVETKLNRLREELDKLKSNG